MKKRFLSWGVILSMLVYISLPFSTEAYASAAVNGTESGDAAAIDSVAADDNAAVTDNAAAVDNDTANKTVTMRGADYTLVFDYNRKAVITSLVVNGREVLEPAQGIYSAVNTSGDAAAWVTTRSLESDPAVIVDGNVVTALLSTSLADETWTFTVSSANVKFQLSRTYKGAYSIVEQGTPMMNFEQYAVENIRWTDDGGNWPVGGAVANANQRRWLCTDKQFSPSVRASKEQISYTLLNSTDTNALTITGASNRDSLDRARATEIYRVSDDTPQSRALRFAIDVSASDLEYATGSPLGYSTGSFDGHVRGAYDGKTSGPIFKPVGVSQNQTDTVTLTFAPDNYDDYYDLGTLNGVDEKALSMAVNDYVRWMMQDTKRGASTEASIAKCEVPAIEMHWLAQLLQLFPSDGAVSAFKAGLNDIRDYLVDTDTGRIRGCRPLTGVYWGESYPDMGMGFVLGVSNTYNICGDDEWLRSMKKTCEDGLDYILNNYCDPYTYLVKNSDPDQSISEWKNDYWQIASGEYNGYLTALLYNTLVNWTELERNVLNDAGKAASYENIAGIVKAYLNLDFSKGGLWSPATNSVINGTGDLDVRFLPVQAQALKEDLLSRDRKIALVNGIEEEVLAHNVECHPHNIYSYFNPGEISKYQKSKQEGGWFGCSDGDFYAGFPAINDRTKIPFYIGAFLNRVYDGFFGASAWERTMYNGSNELWFPTNMMPAWGLYHYGYGFQPAYNELVLAPFISENMVGSVVNYTWRGQPITVTYDSQKKFTINAPGLPTDIRIRWLNQEPGASYTVNADGTDREITADADGNVDILMTSPGSHTFECTNAFIVNPDDYPDGDTNLVTAVDLSDPKLASRNNSGTQAGMEIKVGHDPVTVSHLGRYYFSGDDKIHVIKIMDSSRNCVVRTLIDMKSGDADELGFKYAKLPQAVTLAPNSQYFILSTEMNGEDRWYDYQVKLTSSPDISITKAVYRDNASGTIKGNGGKGNSYGPVTLKYSVNNVAGVTTPSAITCVPNGTVKTAEALGLPSTVTVATDFGDVGADVIWDVDSCPYDPSDTGEQTFTVYGIVMLPYGVANQNNISLNIAISVTVVAAKTLVSVTTPSAVTCVPNGTEKTAEALGLPSSVTLITDDGDVEAEVMWDVASCAYNPSDTGEQTFTIDGIVTLPSGVMNPDSVSLDVTIGVTVVAARTLVSVTTPSAITLVENGTAKTAEALGLPLTVTVATNYGDMQASVTWDVDSSPYDPFSDSAQTFTVYGVVTLPDGVVNPDGVPLATSIIVSVKEAPDSGDDPHGDGDDEDDEDSEEDDEGNIAPSAPAYTAVVEADDGAGTNLPVIIDAAGKRASVDIGTQLGGRIADGERAVVTVPSIPGVNSYAVGIPAGLLSGSDGDGALTFNTDTGSVVLPSNMLCGVLEAEGRKAEISIGRGDKSGLPEAEKEAIGDRPLIRLILTLDGKLTEWNNPDAPVTVSIPYTPTEEELANPESIIVWYIDGSGDPVCIPNGHYDPAAGAVTFTTDHFSDYAVGWNKASFGDVAADAWYSRAVGFIAARGITTGTGGGNYSPDARLTRSQLMVMLMKAYGMAPDENPEDNFADAGSTYYTGYLAAAKRLGIAEGVGGNRFAPEREITRQEMFTLLYNVLKSTGRLPGRMDGQRSKDAARSRGDSGKTLSDFSDSGDIADWAKEAAALLAETGTIEGNAGMLTPAGTATRAEMAQTLYNLLSK